MKKLFIALGLSLALFAHQAQAQLTEGQAAIVGGVIGYVIGKDKGGKEVPQTVYVYPNQPPVFIDPSQVQGYNHIDHGYCAPYKNEAYYHCLGNLQRIRNQDAYRRGLRGY